MLSSSHREQADRDVVQGGHDLWRVTGTNLRAVLIVGEVARIQCSWFSMHQWPSSHAAIVASGTPWLSAEAIA